MNYTERKIVLNYLAHINYKDGLCVIINSMRAKHKGQEQYDRMTQKDRELMLKKIVINYLVDCVSQSLIGYNVHGTTYKRILKLKDLMNQKYDTMTDKEREIIYNKILKN